MKFYVPMTTQYLSYDTIMPRGSVMIASFQILENSDTELNRANTVLENTFITYSSLSQVNEYLLRLHVHMRSYVFILIK